MASPGLSPGEPYTFRVGDAAGGWSDLGRLHGPPAKGAAELRFLAVADLSADENDGGYGGVMRELARESSRADWRYDLLLHAGDLAYDLDTDGGSIGDAFMEDISTIAASVPYMVGDGRRRWRRPPATVRDGPLMTDHRTHARAGCSWES